MEQGRDVMVVPGDVRGGANRGGHALLRDGARLVEGAADVLEELGWTPGSPPSDAPNQGADPGAAPASDHAPPLPPMLAVLHRAGGRTGPTVG